MTAIPTLASATPEHQLETLLDRSPADADREARELFEAALSATPAKAAVVYAAGSLGRKVSRLLLSNNVQVLAFADANPALENTFIDGVPVYSPQEAARRFGPDALFIISTWHPTFDAGVTGIRNMLEGLGCPHTISFLPVLLRFGAEQLPHFLWDTPGNVVREAARIYDAFRLFAGHPPSQLEFVQQVRLRLRGDFAALPELAKEPQYFPKDLFRPKEDEAFIDCGAFDGDTLVQFAKWTEGRFRKAWAFEADPANCDLLQQTVTSHPELGGRVELLSKCVTDSPGTIRFQAAGTGSKISSAGELEVECTTIDDVLDGDSTTFIKMDIEGGEPNALTGARRSITQHRPVLAICIYHLQNHLWELPLFMSELLPDSRFALRSYCRDGLDTIAYAVPAARWRV